jgi:AraC-like DNA-binding protein
VLHPHTLFDRDGLSIYDVCCRHAAGRGEDEEHTGSPGVVLVRRGCFVRSADGEEAVFDPTLAYTLIPEQVARFDHPHGEGDDCTALFLAPALMASVWGGDPELPARPLVTSTALDLEHRQLLALTRRGGDRHEVFERALLLVSQLLAQTDPVRARSGRPATERLRRRLADGVREALAARLDWSLPELAARLAVSPHHLSRVFRAQTGETIARHRVRLRARRALERLADGERDLARLAAELGFADQSHMCRVLRSETGNTPSQLRGLLAA